MSSKMTKHLLVLNLASCTLMTFLVTGSLRGVSSTSSHLLTRSGRTETLNLLKFSSRALRELRTLVYARYRDSADSGALVCMEIWSVEMRTNSVKLGPVVIVEVIIQSIMAVTVIHLLRASSCFISDRPTSLNHFTMRASRMRDIVKGP